MVYLTKVLIKAMQKKFCFCSVDYLKIHIFKSPLHINPKYPGFYWSLMAKNHLVMNLIVESEINSSGFGQLCLCLTELCQPMLLLHTGHSCPRLPAYCSCPSPCCSHPSKGAMQIILKGKERG